jgi:hypothetical protein
MKNYEKIQSMTCDELADYLAAINAGIILSCKSNRVLTNFEVRETEFYEVARKALKKMLQEEYEE